MKKIKIITINDYGNCGNRLQAYALNYYLNKYTNNVKTVVLTSKKECFKDALKRFFPIKKATRKYNKYMKFSKKIKSEKIFDKNGLNTDDNLYIVGSDQVWNPTFSSFAKIFLLPFSKTKYKFSYAASFGIEKLPDTYLKLFKENLSKFSAISTREDAGKDILSSLNLTSELHIDPTMLLTEEEWHKISKKPRKVKKKKFILLYFLGTINSKNLAEIERVSKENDCQIIDFFDSKYNFGPQEFLYLEENAFLICTDSFHASVFGFLFNKPFIVFNRESKDIEKMNSRLDTLLAKFELKDRKIIAEKISKNNLVVNYTAGYKILESERKKSKAFLDKIIKIAKEK